MKRKGKEKKMKKDDPSSSPSSKSDPNEASASSAAAASEEEEGLPDVISFLPNCVLTSILSRLPIKDCARTSILSSRWQHLWTLSHLRIDTHRAFSRDLPKNKKKKRNRSEEDDLNDQAAWCCRAINKILSQHRGAIHSFHLSHCICDHLRVSHHTSDLFGAAYENWARFLRTIDRWIEILAQRGILNLTLHFKLPPRLLTCQSLRSLRLMNARDDIRELLLLLPPNLIELELHTFTCVDFMFPPHVLSSLSLSSLLLSSCEILETLAIPTNLRELRLWAAHLSNDALSCFLSNCQFLDTLVLHKCSGLTNVVHVSSPSLRKLTFNHMEVSRDLLEIFIKDAPNLELLMLGENITSFVNVKVINTHKLRLLGFANADAQMLQLGESCFQRGMLPNLSTHVHSLKTLAVKVKLQDAHEAKALVDLLKCFPCLETLDILCDNLPSFGPPDVDYWQQEVSFDCLEYHLKLVKIKGFVGQPGAVSFARFIIQNAQMLKVISFICDFCFYERLEETKQRQSLLRQSLLKTRASLDAQVFFIKDDYEDSNFSTWKYLFDKNI